jgi:hypothetical protein
MARPFWAPIHTGLSGTPAPGGRPDFRSQPALCTHSILLHAVKIAKCQNMGIFDSTLSIIRFMQIVTVEIINENALNLLLDLESMKLIRVRRDTPKNLKLYKGSMTRQPLKEIDQQLNEMRSEWT